MTEFAVFQERKQALLASLDRLMALVGQDAGLPEPTTELQILSRFKVALGGELLFKVLCVGDFSTGKSTFINRFLLEDDLLPAYPTPTTTLPTRIRYAKQLKARFYRQDDGTEELTDDVRERLRECVSSAGTNKDRVRMVDLEVPAARLAAGVEVIDAPGLNDPDLERMQITLNYLNEADAILFFLNAQQPYTAYQQQFFEGELLTRSTIERLFVIANYWDQIDEPERDEVLEYMQQRLATSLGRGVSVSNTCGELTIVPVSAKTGENADIVQERIWDAIGAKKFSEVLSVRLKRFNDYLDRYCRILDAKLTLIKQDRDQRARRRALLRQELDSYRAQSEQFRRDLSRALKPEFTDYSRQLGDLFDRLAQEVTQVIDDIAAERLDVKRINARLAARVSTLQDRATRRLRGIDDAFLERVKDVVETHKGIIDAPPASALTLDDYFMQWPGIADGWENTAGTVSGGVGVAGLLVGAGSMMPTLAAPAAPATLWTFLLGTGTAANAASPLVVFGVPGLIIGALAMLGYGWFKRLAQEQIKQKLKDLSEDLQRRIEKQKWTLIDRIEGQRDRQIEQICADVDHEITRAYRARLGELDQIDQMTDNGDALQALRDAIDALRLEVNP
jgi:GTPase SAR1 family protein